MPVTAKSLDGQPSNIITATQASSKKGLRLWTDAAYTIKDGKVVEQNKVITTIARIFYVLFFPISLLAEAFAACNKHQSLKDRFEPTDSAASVGVENAQTGETEHIGAGEDTSPRNEDAVEDEGSISRASTPTLDPVDTPPSTTTQPSRCSEDFPAVDSEQTTGEVAANLNVANTATTASLIDGLIKADQSNGNQVSCDYATAVASGLGEEWVHFTTTGPTTTTGGSGVNMDAQADLAAKVQAQLVAKKATSSETRAQNKRHKLNPLTRVIADAAANFEAKRKTEGLLKAVKRYFW